MDRTYPDGPIPGQRRGLRQLHRLTVHPHGDREPRLGFLIEAGHRVGDQRLAQAVELSRFDFVVGVGTRPAHSAAQRAAPTGHSSVVVSQGSARVLYEPQQLLRGTRHRMGREAVQWNVLAHAAPGRMAGPAARREPRRHVRPAVAHKQRLPW